MPFLQMRYVSSLEWEISPIINVYIRDRLANEHKWLWWCRYNGTRLTYFHNMTLAILPHRRQRRGKSFSWRMVENVLVKYEPSYIADFDPDIAEGGGGVGAMSYPVWILWIPCITYISNSTKTQITFPLELNHLSFILSWSIINWILFG